MAEENICGNCRNPIPEDDEQHIVYGTDWCTSCYDNNAPDDEED